MYRIEASEASNSFLPFPPPPHYPRSLSSRFPSPFSYRGVQVFQMSTSLLVSCFQYVQAYSHVRISWSAQTLHTANSLLLQVFNAEGYLSTIGHCLHLSPAVKGSLSSNIVRIYNFYISQSGNTVCGSFATMPRQVLTPEDVAMGRSNRAG